MKTEASVIKMLKSEGDTPDDEIVSTISSGFGSDLPRAVLREMIEFYDADTTGFLAQLHRLESEGDGDDVSASAGKVAQRSIGQPEFESLISEFGFDAHRDALINALRLGHQLVAEDEVVAGDLSLASRFRGQPALAPNEEWPTWRGKEMQFLLQLDLGELPQEACGPLPSSGILSFFCMPEWDYSSADAGRILYHPDPGALSLRPASGDTQDFPARLMTIVPNTLCMPPAESARFLALGMTGNDEEQYYDLVDHLVLRQKDEDLIHQALGYPDQLQGDIEAAACGLAGTPARRWRLVLQVDSDEAISTMWGDGGRIYFMVPDEESTKTDFSDACVVMQCS